MRVPKWCTGPFMYALAFAVAAVAFYVLYPVMWVAEKAAAARGRGDA